MPSEHAKYSPSGADKWMLCAGSILMESSYPNTSSQFADEGTTAHELAELALKSDHKSTSPFIGLTCKKTGMTFTADMADDVQVYVDNILQYAKGHTLLVEQRVDYSDVIEQPDSFGTSDSVIITRRADELQIHDLKFGRGVEVSSIDNRQMKLYGSGARRKYDYLGDFKTIRLVIHQPRITKKPSEWSCTAEELDEFEAEAKAAAAKCEEAEVLKGCISNQEWMERFLNPGVKQCRWCRVKDCPARANFVVKQMTMDMENLDDLDSAEKVIKNSGNTIPKLTEEQIGKLLDMEDLFEGFIKAVRAEGESRIFAGREVPGWKIVEGKLGNRQWRDKEEAEQRLKSMRLKKEEMYTFNLISAPQAETLFKKKKQQKRWESLKELIVRNPGQPHIAPVSDKREALVIKPDASDMAVISAVDDLA